MDVSVRANRILRPMKSYRDVSNIDSAQLSLINFGPGEVCIGMYENSLGDCVFITNKGLHILVSDSKRFISYADIVGIQPPFDKKEDTSIFLILANGEKALVEIRNGSGRFKDVFEFSRFLDRVIEDQSE